MYQRTADQLEDSRWSSNSLFFYGDDMMDKSEQIKKLKQRLDALKIFPNNKEVRILKERIKRQLSNLQKKQDKKIKSQKSNLSRSGKLRRYHNYIRQIRNSFPNLQYNQIRSQLSKRKQGKEVSIPDVIWQNPSP